MKTPRTDLRIEQLKKGHSNCLPKWEDFSRDLEIELEKRNSPHYTDHLIAALRCLDNDQLLKLSSEIIKNINWRSA